MNWWISLSTVLSEFSALPAIWLGRKQRGLLWYYAWASFLADFYSALQKWQWIPRSSAATVTNLFLLTELGLVGFYFLREMPSRVLKWLVGLAMLALACYFLIDAAPVFGTEIRWQDASLFYFLYMLLCTIAFVKVLRNIEHKKIEHSPLFVFSAGFLLYVAVTLLLFLFQPQFRHASAEVRWSIWSVHNVLNLLKNLSIAYVFLIQKKVSLK